MLAAKSPAALMLAQELLLRHLCAIFRMMGFVINWKAGKSECFLIFRGKRAAEHTEKYRPGKSHVPLPENAGADKLRVVDVYKYLGSQVASDNNIVPDAAYRVQRTMISYGPLAVSLFGCSQITRRLRLAFASSLCWSRLLYGVACWTSLPKRAYATLNACYMRVLNRIAGKCRHAKAAHCSDSEVRYELGMPSLHALITRHRLQLLASICRCDVPILPALLAVRVRGTVHSAAVDGTRPS